MAKKMKAAKKAPTKKTPAKKPVKKATAKTPKKVVAKAPAKKANKKPTPPKAVPKLAKKVEKKVEKILEAKPSMSSAKKTVTQKSPAWNRLLTPLDDRLVIQIDEAEKMTAGGLYIPDTVSESGNNKGIVLAVGRGHKNKKGQIRPMDVRPGDRVLFDQYAGSKMILADMDIRILRESEVLGIVE